MACPYVVLTGTCPQLQGLRWESDSRLRIGRSDTSLEIVLSDSSVSRRHAEVLRTIKGWVVRDLGSVCGTRVNGIPVERSDRKLNTGDVLQCGKLTFEVALLDGKPVPPAVPLAPTSPVLTLAVASEGLVQQLKTSGLYVKIQATTQRSWEQAMEGSVFDSRADDSRHARHLLTLLRTGHHLRHVTSLDDLLQSVLDDAVVVLEAQRGSIVLQDEATGELRLRALSIPRPFKNKTRNYSKTLAERCFHQGESLWCTDVNEDADLSVARSVAHGSMSSIICALLRSPRQRLGVLHLDRGPLQEPFNREEFFLADSIAASIAVAIESGLLVEKQREQLMHTVTALAQAVELRDQYTSNHTLRVTDYSLLLAEGLKVSGAERHQIQIGTLLHDIGKIGIADAILRKPGKLTAAEFEDMKLHTVKGAAILETIPTLRAMAPIARHHHERWDGRGYPDHLAGEGIARAARIVAVADAFDAMTSDRPYRSAMTVDQALGELQSHAGTHFDPACVQAFLTLRPRIEEVLNKKGPLNQLVEALVPALAAK